MLIVTQSLRFLTKHCALYEAQSLVINVYVRFLETLLKDLTNDMKFCVIMKQFWPTFALKQKWNNQCQFFFFFFYYCNYTLNYLWRVNDLIDNCYKIIIDTVLLKIVAKTFLSSIISSTILHNSLLYQAL